MVVCGSVQADGVENVRFDVLGACSVCDMSDYFGNYPIMEVIVLHGLTNLGRWSEMLETSNDLVGNFLPGQSVMLPTERRDRIAHSVALSCLGIPLRMAENQPSC